MKYILILTLIFGHDGGRDGQGGVAVSQQEYNTLAACSTLMAKRLSKCFSTSVEAWLNIQRADDLQNETTDLSNVKVLRKGRGSSDQA